MRDYLIWQGITEIRGSRDAIRLAFKYGLIDDAETWMKMLNARNLTSHTYSERLVQELLKEIVEVFYEEFEKLLNKIFIFGEGKQMRAESNFGIPQKTLQKLIEIFSKYKEIKRAILYGSRAKGNFYPGSDIDIAIIAPEMSFSRYLELLTEIDELDIPQKVDLTKYELLDDNVKEHIRKFGKEIYRREED